MAGHYGSVLPGVGDGIAIGPTPTGPPPLTPSGEAVVPGGKKILTCCADLLSRAFATLNEMINEMTNVVNCSTAELHSPEYSTRVR
jgi:hypothetical protein